jgi:hypothetical protein
MLPSSTSAKRLSAWTRGTAWSTSPLRAFASRPNSGAAACEPCSEDDAGAASRRGRSGATPTSAEVARPLPGSTWRLADAPECAAQAGEPAYERVVVACGIAGRRHRLPLSAVEAARTPGGVVSSDLPRPLSKSTSMTHGRTNCRISSRGVQGKGVRREVATEARGSRRRGRAYLRSPISFDTRRSDFITVHERHVICPAGRRIGDDLVSARVSTPLTDRTRHRPGEASNENACMNAVGQ